MSSHQKTIMNSAISSANSTIGDRISPHAQIVFIDSQVEDYQTLAAGVRSGIEIIVIKDNGKGFLPEGVGAV